MGQLRLREQSSILFQFLDDVLVGVFDVLSFEVCDWVDEPAHSVQGTNHLTVWSDDTTARARLGKWSNVPLVSSGTGARRVLPTTSSRSTSSPSDEETIICDVL